MSISHYLSSSYLILRCRAGFWVKKSDEQFILILPLQRRLEKSGRFYRKWSLPLFIISKNICFIDAITSDSNFMFYVLNNMLNINDPHKSMFLLFHNHYTREGITIDTSLFLERRFLKKKRFLPSYILHNLIRLFIQKTFGLEVWMQYMSFTYLELNISI